MKRTIEAPVAIDDYAVIDRIEEAAIPIPPMAPTPMEFGMGWLRENPDFRDYHIDHPNIRPMLNAVNVLSQPKTLSPIVDLRPWCSPIENQGALGSCTANAGAGIVEYMERRANGNHIDGSRLFLYKVTRNMLHWSGDTGAWLRTTMGALACFGIPPESFWPYNIGAFDTEPTPFCYAFADNFKSLKYFRIDPVGANPVNVLSQIRTNLAAGIPAMFGFTVYASYRQADHSGRIPYPTHGDSAVGGHAVVAVGYDDSLQIKNALQGATPTTGAFLIRNSWGTGWGDHGYGWLPYEYVLRGLAVDWWSVISQGYVETGQFGL